MHTIHLDYPINPRPRRSETSPGGKAILAMLEAGEARYGRNIEGIASFSAELSRIPLRGNDPFEAAWINNMLPGLDAAFLYATVAREKPERYIEIGSGTSTKFVRQAIRDHGLSTRIVSIDPEPRADIDRLCDEVMRRPFEDVSPDFFAQMSARDIFYLDGSHRCFQSSDVTVFFNELLAALPPGCLYGIHDIFLPFDYPDAWVDRYYSEQYVLAAYLLGGADGDVIEFPAWHLCVQQKSGQLIRELFDWDTSKTIERHGCAFWLRRSEA